MVVTGEVDLRGAVLEVGRGRHLMPCGQLMGGTERGGGLPCRVWQVGDAREKIVTCMGQGVDLVIVPRCNLEVREALAELDGWCCSLK